MTFVALIVGIALGAAVAWLLTRSAMRAREDALERERRAAEEKLALLERTDEEWAQRIGAVTGDALTRSQRSLLDLADERLKPIRETLDKFEREAKALEERRLKEVSAVGQQLREVVAGQERLRSETGNLVVRLPGGKTIVVDAKVPIDAYLDAVNDDDPDRKRAHLLRHAAQLREHIAKLGQKRYWRQFDSPEFVVMFVDEGLYRAALDQDGSLLEAG